MADNDVQDADSVFGKDDAQNADDVFGKDEVKTPDYSGTFADHMFSQGTRKDVSNAFWPTVTSSVQSADEYTKQIDDWGRKVGIYNDYNDHKKNIFKTFNETFLRPIVNGVASTAIIDMGAAQAATYAGAAYLQGQAEENIENADKQAKESPGLLSSANAAAARAVNTPVGALGELLSGVAGQETNEGYDKEGNPISPGFSSFLPEIAHLPVPHENLPQARIRQGINDIYDARSKGIVGEGEPGFFNTRPVTPENKAAREDFARDAGTPLHEDRPTQDDIHAVARQVNPDVFKEYDEKSAYMAELAKRVEALEPSPAHVEFQDSLEKSPELIQAQEAFQENHDRIMELQPEIDDAYRHARSLLPPEELKSKEVGEVEAPKVGEAPKETPVAEEGSEVEPEKGGLKTAADLAQAGGGNDQEEPIPGRLTEAHEREISQKFRGGNLSDEQADAYAKLISAKYNTRASRFKGKLGTARELFEKDFPEVRFETEEPKRDRKNRTLNQYVGTEAYRNNEEKLRHLSVAKDMESQGKSPEDIRLTTGWHKGLDGKWKSEISDLEAGLQDGIERAISGEPLKTKLEELPETKIFGPEHTFPLSAILYHPELYKHYPEARDIQIKKQGKFLDMWGSTQGWFDDKTNTLNITPYNKKPLSTILHEIQHWIQRKEGFARGANQESIVERLPEKQLQREFKKAIEDGETLQYDVSRTLERVRKFAKDFDIEGARNQIKEEKRIQNEFARVRDRDRSDPERQEISKAYLAHKTTYKSDILKDYFGLPGDTMDVFKLSDPESNVYFQILRYIEDQTGDLNTVVHELENDLIKLNVETTKMKLGDKKALGDFIKDKRAFELYEASAGEMEARDTEARKHLDTYGRQQTPPLESQKKINPEDITVDFKDSDAASEIKKDVQEKRLLVARKMPNGKIRVGEPGDLHLHLIDDDEYDRKAVGHVGILESDMGFVDPEDKKTFLSRQEAMEWVRKHNPEVNRDLAGGGPRDKDKLESTGYEKELDKAKTKTTAETALPPHLEEPFKTTPGKIATEHDAEVSRIIAEAHQRFSEKLPVRSNNVVPFGKKERTFNQDLKEVFFSGLGRAVDNLKLTKASGEQWISSIENSQGVKKEEIEVSGVKEWLKDQKEPVSKKDVQEFLKENELNLQEVVRGELPPVDYEKGFAEVKAKYEREHPGMKWDDADPDIQDHYLNNYWIEREKDSKEARYPNIRLRGGEGYQERVFTLPNKDEERFKLSPEEIAEYNALIEKIDQSALTPEQENRYTYLMSIEDSEYGLTPDESRELDSLNKKSLKAIDDALTLDEQSRYHELVQKDMALEKARMNQPRYENSHWPEDNVLAHGRGDIRDTTRGERTTHLAENQSDIHQAGEKYGYKDSKEDEEKFEKEYNKRYSEADDAYENVAKASKRYQELMDADADPIEINKAEREWDNLRDKARETNEALRLAAARINDVKNRVPNFPFKKHAWEELVMKRWIRLAIDNGTDFSWDTGITNALRAHQAFEHVDELKWNPETHEFSVKQVGNQSYNYLGKVSEEKLADWIGHEVSHKLTNSILTDFDGNRILEKQDITVGGRGMRKAYDERMVNFVNKYTKKWGGKVEEREVPISNKGTIITGDLIGEDRDKYYIVDGPSWSSGAWKLLTNESFNDLKAAQEAMKGLENDTVKVHFLKITDKMKESVLQGQPLFQGTKRGSLTLREGKNLLRLFTDHDVTTPGHELGHHWLEEFMADAAHPDAPEDVKLNAQVARDFLGIEPGKEISRKSHELFAETLERFLRTGKAPSEGLRAVFEKFKEWFKEIYKTVKGLGKPITPQMETFFNEMFAHPEEEARVARSREGGSLKPVRGTGETKKFGLAANTLARATEAGMDDSFPDLPERQAYSKKEASQRAAQMVLEDPEGAKKIAMGDEPPPEDMTPETMYKAVEKHAILTGDQKTVEDLAFRSKLVGESTTMGQRLGSLADEDKTSPVRALKILQKSRDSAIEKRVGSEKIRKEQEQIGKDIERTTTPINVEDFKSFLKSIECDY